MGKITITEEVKLLLSQLSEKTELLDPDGNLVGVFTPKTLADAELYERIKQQIDPEEIERREQETGAVSYEEVKKRLKPLQTSQ